MCLNPHHRLYPLYQENLGCHQVGPNHRQSHQLDLAVQEGEVVEVVA
jgi:hypothetical protein